MANALVAVRGDSASRTELTQLVTFHIANEEYGVDVISVREIIRMTSITHMPNTQHDVEGIINLRGKVIPIINLRRKFGMMETESNSQTRIIVMDISDELIGFVVDSVSEVIRISASEIQPPPTAVSGGNDQEYITGVINREERLLVLLNLDKMFSHDEKDYLTNIS